MLHAAPVSLRFLKQDWGSTERGCKGRDVCVLGCRNKWACPGQHICHHILSLALFPFLLVLSSLITADLRLGDAVSWLAGVSLQTA